MGDFRNNVDIAKIRNKNIINQKYLLRCRDNPILNLAIRVCTVNVEAFSNSDSEFKLVFDMISISSYDLTKVKSNIQMFKLYRELTERMHQGVFKFRIFRFL